MRVLEVFFLELSKSDFSIGMMVLSSNKLGSVCLPFIYFLEEFENDWY